MFRTNYTNSQRTIAPEIEYALYFMSYLRLGNCGKFSIDCVGNTGSPRCQFPLVYLIKITLNSKRVLFI